MIKILWGAMLDALRRKVVELSRRPLLDRWWTTGGGRERRLAERAVRLARLEPHHEALTIGFGKGWAVRAAFDTFQHGSGKLYAIERTEQLVDAGKKFCAMEVNQGVAELLLGVPGALPFQDDFFDRVLFFHEYLFWPDQIRCLRELFRVSRPGALLVCTVDLRKLYELEKQRRLPYGADPDPINFMSAAERVGFERVRIEYLKHHEGLHAHEEFQAIFAEKPLEPTRRPMSDEEFEDAEYQLMEVLARQEFLRRARKLHPSTSSPDPDKPPTNKQKPKNPEDRLLDNS